MKNDPRQVLRSLPDAPRVSSKAYERELKKMGQVDLRDTKAFSSPFIKEKIKEAKWKLDRGLI